MGETCDRPRCPNDCTELSAESCVAGQCKCKESYFGSECEHRRCHGRGTHNGTALAPCVCEEAYEGDDCEGVSHGIVLNGSQYCREGFGGADCAYLTISRANSTISSAAGESNARHGGCMFIGAILWRSARDPSEISELRSEISELRLALEAARVVAGSAEVAVAAALRAQNDAERKAAEATKARRRRLRQRPRRRPRRE